MRRPVPDALSAVGIALGKRHLAARLTISKSSKIALKGTPLNAAAPEAVFRITLPAGPGRV